jgi:hypothetical protein
VAWLEGIGTARAMSCQVRPRSVDGQAAITSVELLGPAPASSRRFGSFTQHHGMYWLARRGDDSGYRQRVVNRRVSVATDTCRDSGMIVNPVGDLRRQTMRAQLPIMKMVPCDKVVMVRSQSEIVALANVVTVEA